MSPVPVRRVLAAAAGAVIVFLGVEAAVFRSGFYASILKPGTSASTLEALIRTELQRQAGAGRRVLEIGDSRMSFLPRIATGHAAPRGYSFGGIGMGGTSPRTWYYMLRDADPSRRRYDAILLPVESYADYDQAEDLADRPTDLNFLIARLRLSDVFEFAWSFRSAERRWQALRGGLLKGAVFQRDFQDMLPRPKDRIAAARLSERQFTNWVYGHEGENRSLAGLQVDWKARSITFPEGMSPDMQRLARERLLPDPRPDTGRLTEFRKRWFERILDHYRDSPTRLVFLRLPRGPAIWPESNEPPRPGFVRELARRPRVLLLDEHAFDSLERPEYFMDPLHLNRDGMAIFSRLVATVTIDALEARR